MVADELAYLGVADVVRRLRTGDLTTVELTAALLGRIEALDRGPHGLRAVLQVNPRALDEARAADAARAAGDGAGPLHGVPVLLKDNIDTVAPMRTTAGSLALSESFAPADAPLVGALRAGGALVLGKANLSEWANYRSTSSSSGWSAVGGLTRNPHDPTRSAGGSSSGSAAAVAAGLAPLSVGTETDGSISCPAALTGIVGLKPTVGLIPRTGVVPLSFSQDTPGPMARSVRDAAALLTVLAARDPADPMTARTGRPGPLNYESFCSERRLEGLRIGVPRSTALFGGHAATDALVLRAIDLLADLGAEIVDDVALPGLEQMGEHERIVLDHEVKVGLATYLSARGGPGPQTIADVIAFNDAHSDLEMPWFGQEILRRAERTTGLEAEVYRSARAEGVRAATVGGIDAALSRQGLHALAMPCYPPAWVIDLVLGDPDVTGCSTLPAVAGYPLFSVPCGAVPGPAGPLPVGLALTAGAWSEPVLLRIAAAYEAAAGIICPRPGPARAEV